MKKIDIIGAGICGLTTALALEKKGFRVTIYEQLETIKPVGAGIILAGNAMNVYRKLNIDKEIKNTGSPLNSINITKPNLSIISSIDLKYFKKKYDLQSIVIHRGDLQQILLNSLKETKINFGYKLKDVIREKDGCVLHFENGKSIKSNTILAADGIHSKTRKIIVPEYEIRKTDQICWRGVTRFNLPLNYKNQLNEAWGKGSRFAFTELNENYIYWYALKTFKNKPEEFTKEKLNIYFKDYHPIVHKIISKTKLENIHTAVIEDLKPIKKWYHKHICLLGDAAHATTPNMGQGACQAIEDSYTIAMCLSLNFDNLKAFESYQKKRISKAHMVVNQSSKIGEISHWKNPIGIFLRNFILKIIPSSANYYQLEKLFALDQNKQNEKS